MKPLIIAFIAACIAFAAEPYLFPATPMARKVDNRPNTSAGWTNIHATGKVDKTGIYPDNGLDEQTVYEP